MFEQASCIPGLPTAQIRQANKSSERRFGRAKPAPVPITDVPEERPIGLPQQKSPDPKVDPCSVAELGCVAATSPRTRVSHKKATEQPSRMLSEFAESCRDAPRESWDLEGSLAVVKKKKKKPKQKRNQLPRTMEFWDENVAVSKAPRNSPFAVELQKPDVCPVLPYCRAPGMPEDAQTIPGGRVLDEQNAFSAPGQQARKPNAPLESVLDAKNGEGMKREDRRDDGSMLQSKGKRKEVPFEQVGKTTVGESGTAKVPTKPTERDFPDKNGKREYKESKRADLMPSLSEAINLSKVATALETKPSELLLSDKDKEGKYASPGREAFSDAVHPERQTSGGCREEAAKKRGSCEKSKGVGRESLQQPAAPSDELPNEPKAAEETKPVSSEKRVADDFSTSEGVLKSPRESSKMPATPSVLPEPEEAAALRSGQADGSSEQPFLLPAKRDAADPPASTEAADRATVADSPDKNKGKGFTALEQQTGKDPNITHGMDRPKKKRGEGKVKKIKSFSEQMMFSEDVGKFSDGVRADEAIKETAFPDKGRGFAARGQPSVSVTRAYPADKPKKRGSDGRSKKGERSFFQQPFLENKVDPSSFPDATDKTSDKGRERGCVAAECFQENASDVTKMQRSVELVTEKPKESVGKKEIGDLGVLVQPVPLGSGREDTEHLAVADAVSKTEEVDLLTTGEEAGTTPASGAVAVRSDAAVVADKARKRCSDGKRKKTEKSPLGRAAVLDAGVETSSSPSTEKVGGSSKERAFEKDEVSGFERELSLENLTGITKEVLEKPKIQSGDKSFSNQPILSGHKIETAEPEVVNAKETWPANKDKELDRSELLPEHRADTALARGPTGEPVMDAPKKESRDAKGKNSLGHSVPGAGDIPAVGEEVGSVKQAQSFAKGKETDSSTSASLPGDLTGAAEAPAPAVPLAPGKSHASDKERCKKLEANSQQPRLPEERRAGAEMFPETADKCEAEGLTPRSGGGGGLPIPEHPAVADHALATAADRSKKRSYDGSNKKGKNASEQPVLLEAKPNRREAQPRVGPAMDYAMEDMEFVDENRNIKNFPVGPQMLWNNRGSDLESSAQAAGVGPDDAGNVASAFPKRAVGARSEGRPPPEAVAEESGGELGAGAKEERQARKPGERPVSLGDAEPGKEGLKKDGQAKAADSQGGREAGKPLSAEHSVQQDHKSKKDKVHLSPAAKGDDKEIRTADKKQNTDSASSDLPQMVPDSKDKPAPVGAKGTEKLGATVPSGEEDGGRVAPGLAAAAASEAEAWVEAKAGEAELDGGGKGEQLEDDKAAEAEAAAQTAQMSPKDDDKCRSQPAAEDAAHGGEAHPKDAAAAKPGVAKPEDATKGKEEEREEKAVKEAKKERVKAAEQVKGYMRPTKSRGVPTVPARPAAPEREKQRQLKPTGMNRPQRHEKGVCLRCELAAVIQTACAQDLAICQCVGMNT